MTVAILNMCTALHIALGVFWGFTSCGLCNDSLSMIRYGADLLESDGFHLSECLEMFLKALEVSEIGVMG